MPPVFVDDRLDPGQLGDLMDQGIGVLPGQHLATPPAGFGLAVGGRAELLGGTKARNALRWPDCPPRFRRDGGVGGLRFRPIGSEEGGLEELVELSWSRAWRSRTVASKAAIRSCIDFQASRRAAWASAGTVPQSGSGIGSCWLIYSNTQAVYKVFGV